MLDTTTRPVLLAQAANALLAHIQSGDVLTRTHLNEAMRDAFGATPAMN